MTRNLDTDVTGVASPKGKRWFLAKIGFEGLDLAGQAKSRIFVLPAASPPPVPEPMPDVSENAWPSALTPGCYC